MEKEPSSLQQAQPGVLGVFGAACPSGPGALEKPCLPTQPFGVRIGISELALDSNVGSGSGCF